MNRRIWLGLGASAAVIVVAAGVTFGVSTLLGVTFEESEPKPLEGLHAQSPATTLPEREPPPGAIQTARYPGLSLCVQAIGTDATVESIAKSRIETALLELQQHRFWRFLQLDGAPALVDIGCPSEPLAARPGIKWREAQRVGGDWLQYAVTEPSFYRTFVSIMPLERVDQLLGGVSIRVAPQELVQADADVYGEETNAIYISPEELEDPTFVLKQLKVAVGLVGEAD